MKSTSLLLFFLLPFILTACNKENTSQGQTKASNITEANNTTEVNTTQAYSQDPVPQIPQTFILTDIDERDINITLNENKIISQDISQSLILLNIFATWCPPCKGTLLDLNQLQKKYQKDLLVVGVLVNDDLNSTDLRHFIKKHNTNFYISYSEENTPLAMQIAKRLELPENFPIPLMVLYKDGELFRYYEGAVPIEIMENELKQALK